MLIDPMNTDLIPITDNKFRDRIYEQHQEKGGVYKIIALRNGEVVPVNRFLGIDYNGVLYIGSATVFIDRVIDLKKSIHPDYKGKKHICGRRYKSIVKIAKHYPIDDLHIKLIPTDTATELERKYLREYFNEFGEVPPLNAI